MSLAEQYEILADTIDPRKQAICIHRGKVNAEGAPVVAPRVDPETGLPLLNVFLRSQLPDVLMEGWEVFAPPAIPNGVRPAQVQVEETEHRTTATKRRRK